MSRGSYRGIYCSLIDDPDFQRLSSNARLVFLIVRLCAQAGPAAIFRYYPALLVEQTGLKMAAVEHALNELSTSPSSEAPWIVREDVVLWVRNGLRHDPTMRLSDRKHRISVERALDGLPQLSIVLTFCDYYQIARPSVGPQMILPANVARGSPSRESRVESRESRETTLSNSRSTLPGPNGQPGKAQERRAQALEVLTFLNEKRAAIGLGQFRPVDTHLRLIAARLAEGATVQDCRSIIARKIREWKDEPKSVRWIRPLTIFRASNFENYLGELQAPRWSERRTT